MAMPMPLPPRRAPSLGRLQVSFQLFCTSAKVANDVSYVSYPVEVHLELVDLLNDLVVARYLGVRIVDQFAGPVVDLHGDYLCLTRQVFELLLNVLHDSVEVTSQSSERAAVDHQYALRRSPAGGARGRGVGTSRLRLVVPQQRYLLVGQAELGVWDRVRLRGRHGCEVEVLNRRGSAVVDTGMQAQVARVADRRKSTSLEQRRICRYSAALAWSASPPGDGATPENVRLRQPCELLVDCGTADGRMWVYRWSAGQVGSVVTLECGASSLECRCSRRSGCMWERRVRLLLERPGRLRRARRHCFDATVPVIVTGPWQGEAYTVLGTQGRETRRGKGPVRSTDGAEDKKEGALECKEWSSWMDGWLSNSLLVIHTPKQPCTTIS